MPHTILLQYFPRDNTTMSIPLYYCKCGNRSKCTCNVSAEKLYELFTTTLSEITLQEKYIDLFQLQLRKLIITLNKEREKNVNQYKTRLTELEQKIENLEER